MSGSARRSAAPPPAAAETAVPDVLAPGLKVVFCGINPGLVSAAAGAHFANSRNDFWRLLADAGFTPTVYDPQEQFSLLELGIGLTNAAHRTTRGSGDLRRGDFAGSRERLEGIARELCPRAIAFVGKEAFRGPFRARAELGPQTRTLGDVGLFVLPSTSPANAAVPYPERLRWFRELNEWLTPFNRAATRALVLGRSGRTLLVQFRDETGQVWWATPGGGIEEGENVEDALRRELGEEVGLSDFELGPEIWRRDHTFAWDGRILRQRERIWLVRVAEHQPEPRVDLAAEHVAGVRWWTTDELDAADDTVLVPRRLPQLVRGLLANGPPADRAQEHEHHRRHREHAVQRHDRHREVLLGRDPGGLARGPEPAALVPDREHRPAEGRDDGEEGERDPRQRVAVSRDVDHPEDEACCRQQEVAQDQRRPDPPARLALLPHAASRKPDGQQHEAPSRGRHPRDQRSPFHEFASFRPLPSMPVALRALKRTTT
jgi:double-stranded uracil-DNA glycosylase